MNQFQEEGAQQGRPGRTGMSMAPLAVPVARPEGERLAARSMTPVAAAAGAPKRLAAVDDCGRAPCRSGPAEGARA